MLKPNNNQPGYVFTTRPDLNLDAENLKTERKMVPLLTENPNSIMRAIRLILSPRLGGIHPPNTRVRYPRTIKSPLVNPNYPFIAVSDNSAKTLTGWPSGQLGVRRTNAGVLKEVHIMADGPATYNGEFSLNLSANTMHGNPVLYLYYFWILYIGFTYYQTHGIIPWPEYLGNGRMDYTCRIYRLIMDETKTFVTEIAATGYAIPSAVDIGPFFDYNSETPRPFSDKTTEIEFTCSGAIYLDEILIQQFNNTVYIYNPYLRTAKERELHYIKVPKIYQTIFNNQCFPRINPITRELEWWVPVNVFKANMDLVRLCNLEKSLLGGSSRSKCQKLL